jgi:hypothetical protein
MNLREEIARQKKLMQLDEFSQDKTISLQVARDRRMFGPVYHGTTEENRQQIHQQGFRLDANQSHGYPNREYAMGYPPPIHHLGYGIYFTTSKSIAKNFNRGTGKGLREFYLDVPRMTDINFGSNKNMMKWWLENGYDGEMAKQSEAGRIMATKKMTESLNSKYDAVWFKGKGLYRLLDGDQIVVFDPTRIYYVDNALAQPMEMGSKVIRVIDGRQYKYDPNSPITIPAGTVGVIMGKTPTDTMIAQWKELGHTNTHWAEGAKYVYTIKWAKGGTESGVLEKDVKPK